MKCTHSENLSNYYLQLDLVIEGNSGLTFTSLLLFVVILLIYTDLQLLGIKLSIYFPQNAPDGAAMVINYKVS